MTVPASLLDELAAALPAGVLVTDPDILAGYRHDRAADPDAAIPRALVRASGTADVQATLAWANTHRVPVVPRGAGTSLSGGSGGLADGIVLSTERMRAITVDAATRTAVAQPGLLNAEVKKAASAHGLWYPPDPSSFEICTIGGNAATNAGGLCCVKYGVTGDYVLGLEVALADGTAVRLGGPRVKDVAGLPLTKLFVGSEGTLGIITEVTLRLVPPPPPASTMVATFGSVDAAAAAVVTITATMRPSMLEFMDRATIGAVEDMLRMGLDRSAEAMLIARSDAPGKASAEEIDLMVRACREAGAHEVFSTDDEEEGEAFAAARRLAIPAVERTGSLLLEDVGVPIPALPALVRGVADLAAEYDLTVAVIAHAGDGNTHPLIVFDPADEDMTARAGVVFGRIMDLAIDLGGTITGEHGVGRLKKAWLQDQVGPDVLALTQRIKTALDPNAILNPGVML